MINRTVVAKILCSSSALVAGLWCGFSLLRPAVGHADVANWEVPREGPLPQGARSFVVTDLQHAPVFANAGMTDQLMGHVGYGAAIAVHSPRSGRGCRAQWLQTEGGWVCGDRGMLSVRAPTQRDGIPDGDEALPWAYSFTGRDDVRAYRNENAALTLSQDPAEFQVWERNWGFAVESVIGAGEGRVLRTRGGFYVRRRDVYRAAPTSFSGAAFRTLEGTERGIAFGWVALGATRRYEQPEERGASTLLPRLSVVRVYGVHGRGRRAMARIGDSAWARADHLRWVAPEPPPASVNVQARERWIDVDIASQTLIAYEGAEPVYATMVSTGAERFATATGSFRVWGKYLAHTMDNTENQSLPNHFRLGDVPYVQFFDGDRGLHGVYWHDQFGTPRSHGCVNLAPNDARWLFRFTAQPLPPGWISRATASADSTLIRVRGRYAFNR
ncbi:MAG: L,D-transpeptidase [Deltaproteobacteria bacterium]|nr:L,D-transpeptidase [Deltaproteobacteria bacterium]